MTEDIFIAEILGHKLLPGATALSVGQSYKDFLHSKALSHLLGLGGLFHPVTTPEKDYEETLRIGEAEKTGAR